jgi:hypothetical protein
MLYLKPPGTTSAIPSCHQQVNGISERLSDLEDHVSDLSTDVRLQARKSTLALPLPPLSTAGSHDGSVHSLGHSGAVSPRGAQDSTTCSCNTCWTQPS